MSKVLEGYFDLSLGWVRVFGWGVGWKDLRKHRLFFSERNGYVKTFRLGHWSFKVLRHPERG